jgi:hypothetical protein
MLIPAETHRPILFSLVLLLSWTLAVGASAGPVEFSVTGVISEVDDDNDDVLSGQLQVGMPFTGVLHWDTAVPDDDPDPTEGAYSNLEPNLPPSDQIRLSVVIADLEIGSDQDYETRVELRSDYANDRLMAISQQTLSNLPAGIGSPSTSILQFYLESDFDPLADDSLPTTLDLADWNLGREFTLRVVRAQHSATITGEIQASAQDQKPPTPLCVDPSSAAQATIEDFERDYLLAVDFVDEAHCVRTCRVGSLNCRDAARVAGVCLPRAARYSARLDLITECHGLNAGKRRDCRRGIGRSVRSLQRFYRKDAEAAMATCSDYFHGICIAHCAGVN